MLVAGWVESLAAFTYSDTDLLLVFRKTGYNDLLFNVGSVSNYLGLPNGSTAVVSNWDFSLVQSNFSADLSGVKYVLMAVTTSSDPLLRAWLSDSISGAAPTDETQSRWTQQRGKINAVGSRATTYPESTNQSLSLSPGDPDSYSYIASSGGALDMSTMGGSAPFPVEQGLGASVRFYELKVSTDNPKQPAAQVGRFTLRFSGSLSFVAGPDTTIVVTNRVYVE